MKADALAQHHAPIRKGSASLSRVLRSGHNCWVRADVGRASLLVDGEQYFATLERALKLAERSILIIGWDFDAAIKLTPESPPLGDFLRSLVEARPELEVRVLVWSLSTVHAPGATLPLILGAPWQDHPRIQLRLDRNHPLYGAHHQKIVCIDDALAFAGGIDLTVQRWDTNRHSADDPDRVCPDGSPYGPVHDLQMVVDGDGARAVAAMARQRWEDGTGERTPACSIAKHLWPKDLDPDFESIEIAIARTAPGLNGKPTICESALLTVDALKAARRFVYIEAQYLTARRVRKCLVESLSSPHGPEVVVVLTRSSHGLLERFIMGANRDRLVRRLKQADRYDRLRVYYPVVPAVEGECEVLIHAKLMIVDDVFMRVGSANLNNRSVGLDTECDLAIEAADERTSQVIARLRERLLAEHLDVAPNEVAKAFAAEESLIGTIERLNRNSRGLRAIEASIVSGPTWSFPGTRLLDPEEPFRLAEYLRGWRVNRATYAPAASSALVGEEGDLPLLKNSSVQANSRPPSTSGRRK